MGEYTEEGLGTLSRRELQAVAKKHGVKGNGKSTAIVELLLAKQAEQEEGQQEEGQQEKQQQQRQQQQDETPEPSAVTAKEPATAMVVPGSEAIFETTDAADSGATETTVGSAEAGDTAPAETGEAVASPVAERRRSARLSSSAMAAAAAVPPLQHPTLERAVIVAARKRPSGKRARGRVAQAEPAATKATSKTNAKATTSSRKKRRLSNKENGLAAKTPARKAAKGRFDKAHEKLFSSQTSILQASTVKKAKRPLAPTPTPTPNLGRARQQVPSSCSSSMPLKSAKKPTFDLQESLRRPITWKMKKGPLLP